MKLPNSPRRLKKHGACPPLPQLLELDQIPLLQDPFDNFHANKLPQLLCRLLVLGRMVLVQVQVLALVPALWLLLCRLLELLLRL